MTVGVAISTHRRPAVLAQALAGWSRFMPDLLVVTHDINGDGVAATKNRGIAALMAAGCEHLFLVDDDCWPIHRDWSARYVDDPEPHLMHCWGKSRLVSDDGVHSIWSWPRGVMLYAERRVVERVGGMRVEFGRWGVEHVEWSRRIHHAGLTTHKFADVSGSLALWEALDRGRTVASTVGQKEREASKAVRHALYDRFRGSAEYVRFG